MTSRQLVKSSRSILALVAGVVLACVLVPETASAQSCLNNNNPNLVKNGGFESGSGFRIPNWTAEWDSSVDKYVKLDRSNPHGGVQDLSMGTITAPNDIVQLVKGTSNGTVYTICFWLYSSPNPSAGVTSFDVLWNNVTELSLTNSAQFGYQYFSVNVIAQGNDLDYVRFRERNKQGFYYLDDVAVQECTGCGLAPDREFTKTR